VKESHHRTWEELQKLKVEVVKLQQRMSGSGKCDDGDGPREGSECIMDGKGKSMGAPMNTDSVEVKDDIVHGMDGADDVVGDGQYSLIDKAGRTSRGEERRGEVAGDGVRTHVHRDEQNKMCSTGRGQSVRQPARTTTTRRSLGYGKGRRVSNIAMRMKTQPRRRRASALRASPYTNPLHGTKSRKGRQNKSVTVCA